MLKIKTLFLSSYRELRNVSCITLLAMMGAISIILGYFTFMPVETIKITFNFLPNEFVYYLFGPAIGPMYGAALDILTFFIKPTGTFFYGFTVSSILNGLWFGAILYKRPLNLKRVFAAKLVHAVIVNLLLNTYWLTQLYGYNFNSLLKTRVWKVAIMFPVETLLLYTLIRSVHATGIINKIYHSNGTQKENPKLS